MPHDLPVRQIVSGGQTGVDRGALDAAIALGLDHGGWCPRGRLAEDGTIDARYRLREAASPDYAQRTLKNVVDSDATLILAREPLSGGTALTRQLAEQQQRPCLVIDPGDESALADNIAAVHAWLREHQVEVLNVAGPRESLSPGIRALAKAFLVSVFTR